MKLKAECQRMVPVIGSGKFIMTPIITDDGQPIEDPNGYFGENGVVLTSSSAGSDKKVIQWMLSLHQIGMCRCRTPFSFLTKLELLPVLTSPLGSYN